MSVASVFDLKHDDIKKFDDIVFHNYETCGSLSLENESFMNTIHHFLSKLASDITLNMDYSSQVEEVESPMIKVDHLGMGNRNVWHGTPDARIRGTEVVSEVALFSERHDEQPQPSSQGDSTCIEAKRKIVPSNVSQVVAATIVASFTENNIHKTLPSAIPSILINEKHAFIIIYDCQLDILLVSSPIVFKEGDTIKENEAFILWVAINHRYIKKKHLKPIQYFFCHLY